MNGFLTLLGKEMRVESRSRELTNAGILMTGLVLVLASLAWSDAAAAGLLAPGALWIAFTFASTVSLGRSLNRERDRGTWDALALLPVDWGVVFLAKVAANLIVLLVVQAVGVPLFSLLFDVDLVPIWPLLGLVLLLGGVGLCAAGTLLAAVSVHGRAREMLLPILLFPALIPLLMMAVQATQRVVAGAPLQAVSQELALMAAFDTIFLAIGWVAFDHLLGE